MWEHRIVIILGLPNSTEVTQDMYDLYQTFKPQMYVKKSVLTLLIFIGELMLVVNNHISHQLIPFVLLHLYHQCLTFLLLCY